LPTVDPLLGLAPFLVLGLLAVLVVAGLVARRGVLDRAARRRRTLEDRLRPAALDLIDGGGQAPTLADNEVAVFEDLLLRTGRALRSDARGPIAAWFEANGSVARELAGLTARQEWRRAAAAFTLGDLGSHAAVRELVPALEDRSRDVRMAAARSLGRLGAEEGVGPLLDAVAAGQIPRGVGTAAVGAIGTAATAELLRRGNDPRPGVRRTAAELLGVVGDADAAAGLVAWLRDPAPEVRGAAAHALERLADARAAEALVAALDDDDASVRVAVATALGNVGGSGAADRLLLAARTDAFEPARAAARALARLDPARLAVAALEPSAGPHLHEAADRAALAKAS
jgi:hypothetical protein